ncbi:MAG: 4-hydroxy-tetrahydrodipicolinate synthase [Candidatus Micrarchaeota archaeon]
MLKLEGVYTAIITPFVEAGVNGAIDWEAYERILKVQKSARIAGIVPCGTTGESPTLSNEEHDEIIERTVERAEGMQVIAGTGSNCTWEAIERTKRALDVGADASLQVCPYYNKPNQEGLFRHFGAIAEAVDLPMVLYNVPGRSAKEIAPETVARLAREYSNIVAVKEASGKEEVWKKVRELAGNEFTILSGNDGDTYEMMKSYGCTGVISVASNVAAEMLVKFVELGSTRKFEEMEKENRRLASFFDALFIDTNPIMVKEAAGILGISSAACRLPLCETSEANRKKLAEVLKQVGLLK